VLIGVIEKIPDSISPKKYLEIENIVREFSKEIEIPLDHLDIVLWYKETKEIFK
jgi:N-glycosylase/DNA lyase